MCSSHLPSIYQALAPAHAAKKAEALRLHYQRNIEVLRYGIRAERHAAHRPQEHHGRGQAFCTLRTVVSKYLRHELDTPAHGSDRAQDVRGDRYRFLRCHGEEGLESAKGEVNMSSTKK